jgi:hypothetical protein
MACQGTQDVGWTRGHPWVGVGVSMGVGGREVMAVGGGVGGGVAWEWEWERRRGGRVVHGNVPRRTHCFHQVGSLVHIRSCNRLAPVPNLTQEHHGIVHILAVLNLSQTTQMCHMRLRATGGECAAQHRGPHHTHPGKPHVGGGGGGDERRGRGRGRGRTWCHHKGY